MRKHLLAALGFALCTTAASSQTLATYGKDTITVQDFVKAYKKNSQPGNQTTTVSEYLDLYIASRLKIKEALDRRYDTLPQLVMDLQNLRSQILPTYLNDETAVKQLLNEAFTRSQKDIRLSHIFIGFNGVDTTAAWRRIKEAQMQLKNGKDFSAVAKQYSEDASVKDNGGDLGYITVFTLPYALENLAYGTQVGKVSHIYRSKSGYHIFKNVAERKAAGRLKLAQILIAFPPEADVATKGAAKKLVDSLYNRLQKGDDFGKLATRFSNDMISAAANGQLPEIGVGHYDSGFENVAFGLAKDGAYSKPVLTSHGWHIIKRLSQVPVITDRNSSAVQDDLRARVQNSDRMNSIKEAQVKKIIAKYQNGKGATTELWAYSDSVLDQKHSHPHSNLTPQSALFSLGVQHIVTAADWIMFAQMHRAKENGAGLKSYQQLWDEFVTESALEYYKNNLEQFNPDFKAQINEFRDGNLFFEIMQKEVWGPAQIDTAAIEAYYNKNRTKYVWNESADAIIFYANDITTGKMFEKELLKSPASWRNIVSSFEQQVVVDSGRYELTQIPGATKSNAKTGTVTPMSINKEDNTASFAYFIKMYSQPAQRSFTEAKGLVINDYQAQLEKEWLDKLRKKYPVVVDQKALQSIRP
jgi:peptidyl-prolyl cis-trans isomerase SurA